MKHPDFQALDENAIRRELADGVARRIAACEIVEEATSTNDRLLHQTVVAAGFYVCLAESQTAGKGRRGRKLWHSPKNGNLYLSVLHHGARPRRPAWLGLTAAAEVVSALAAAAVGGLGVKWPNDIYRDGGKLGGVLVESKGDRCVVGLGLNLHLPEHGAPEAGGAWAALDTARRGDFDRCKLASAMIAAVVRAFDRVARDPVGALMKNWRRHDLLAGREVAVLAGEKALAGVVRGVDEHGGLRVEHHGRDGSEVRVYYSDNVSIRW